MDKSLIPKGMYCYESLKMKDNGRLEVIGKCPYWKNRKEIDDKEVNDQNYGYCLYLGKGDIEINHEDTYILTHPKDHPDYDVPMTADEIGFEMSLLWDMCKMCNENDDWKDDENVIG